MSVWSATFFVVGQNLAAPLYVVHVQTAVPLLSDDATVHSFIVLHSLLQQLRH